MPTSVKKNRRKQRRIVEIERQRRFMNEYPDMLVILIISVIGENK